MQLTYHTDFALRMLLFLALREDGESSTLQDISDKFKLSRNHLIKISQKLATAGYLSTSRGRRGGVSLAVKPIEVNIGSIVRLMEPRLEPIDCSKPFCPFAGRCRLKRVFCDAQKAYLDVLDSYTLQDMLNNPKEREFLLQRVS